MDSFVSSQDILMKVSQKTWIIFFFTEKEEEKEENRKKSDPIIIKEMRVNSLSFWEPLEQEKTCGSKDSLLDKKSGNYWRGHGMAVKPSGGGAVTADGHHHHSNGFQFNSDVGFHFVRPFLIAARNNKRLGLRERPLCSLLGYSAAAWIKKRFSRTWDAAFRTPTWKLNNHNNKNNWRDISNEYHERFHSISSGMWLAWREFFNSKMKSTRWIFSVCVHEWICLFFEERARVHVGE